MKTEFYEEFLLLAETGSYSAAAARLPFTQAALTQHIQQMEEQLGVRLFRRTTRRVELTDEGELVLPYARQICQLKAEGVSAVTTRLSRQHFDVVVGFHPLAARYSVLDAVNSFQAAHPEVSIAIREQEPARLVKAFGMEEYDFMVLEERDEPHSDGCERFCLNKDSLVAVVPANHPLAAYGEALMTQLSKEKFCMQPENTFVYQLGMSACEKRGFLPTVVFTSQVIGNIVEMVGNGAGVALLMRHPAERFKTGRVSIVGVIPPVCSSINLICRRERLTDRGRCFLEFMKSRTAEN